MTLFEGTTTMNHILSALDSEQGKYRGLRRQNANLDAENDTLHANIEEKESTIYEYVYSIQFSNINKLTICSLVARVASLERSLQEWAKF